MINVRRTLLPFVGVRYNCARQGIAALHIPIASANFVRPFVFEGEEMGNIKRLFGDIEDRHRLQLVNTIRRIEWEKSIRKTAQP